MRLAALAVLAILPLAACSNIGGRPIPTGYPANPEAVVLKPQGADAPSAWKQHGDYDTWLRGYTRPDPIPAPAMDDLAPVGEPEIVAVPDAVPVGVAYNSDVSVYPIDGPIDGNNPAPAYAEPSDLGELAKTVYFAHGSALLVPSNRKALADLARSRRDMALAVTVVGHASQRVDGVKDPVKKKMINFNIAQKRAEAVVRALKNAGLKPAWVKAVSRGDAEPNRNPPPGLPGEAADRRAEVYVKPE